MSLARHARRHPRPFRAQSVRGDGPPHQDPPSTPTCRRRRSCRVLKSPTPACRSSATSRRTSSASCTPRTCCARSPRRRRRPSSTSRPSRRALVRPRHHQLHDQLNAFLKARPISRWWSTSTARCRACHARGHPRGDRRRHRGRARRHDPGRAPAGRRLGQRRRLGHHPRPQPRHGLGPARRRGDDHRRASSSTRPARSPTPARPSPSTASASRCCARAATASPRSR